MATYNVSPQRQSLLADTATLGLLPPELRRSIQNSLPATSTSSTSPNSATPQQQHSHTSFLDAVAQAALLPRLTRPIFAHFGPLFADICARWLICSRRPAQDDAVLAAFSRVLPLAPYLSVLLDRYLEETTVRLQKGSEPRRTLHTLLPLYSLGADHSPRSPPHSPPLDTDADIVRILLVLWRLVNLDAAAYANLVPSGLHTYFNHTSPPVRYLAIRIFCVVHAAADFKLESLLRGHMSEGDNLDADFDGTEVDYAFLTLHEHQCCRDLHERLLAIRANTSRAAEPDPAHPSSIQSHPETQETESEHPIPFVLPLTPLVCAWGRSVIPRLATGSTVQGMPNPAQPTLLVKTSIVLGNLESLATCFQRSEPILLRGLPGSGKTSLVREAARELGMDAGLVTLHLNEQTDAKTLIGLYSTGSKPGSFEWRPGVLTSAVQEGRWVLIEDLDRAPTEVMSTLLPLIERRELLIPSRRETIKAGRTFRIFATVRTALGLNGQETTRLLLGERLWQQLSVQPLPPSEVRQVVHDSFPSLHALENDILSVFDQLTSLSHKKTGISPAAIERPMTLRDLLKWCRRLEHTLARQNVNGSAAHPQKNGTFPQPAVPTLSETALIGIFLDAVDCFAGSVKDHRVRQLLGQHIAQALRIPPEVAEHALILHEPPFRDSERQLVVGRATLQKPRRARLAGLGSTTAKGRPFATTAHARRLLEQIAVAVGLQESLLLVGETGIGKTTVVQQLAESMGHKLVVVNLSQQSEVGDLLGGFKPVNARSLAMPLKEEFEDLFAATGISAEKNEKYLKRVSTSIARGRWADVCRLWQQAPKMFDRILEQLSARQAPRAEGSASGAAGAADADGQPTKRRKTESSKLKALLDLKSRWVAFDEKLEQFAMQVASGTGAFAFAFVEGKIVQAVRNGDWLLLDEINLASPDTLESIADLLSSGPGDTPSILLSETGEIDKIEAHPDFRVFGAMNPATDVGKRDLPIGLRSRFTELYVASPDRDVQDLVPIIKVYLRSNAKATDRIVERVARLYLAIKSLADEKRLVDGANEVPHYSLRTLTRVLRYVDDVAPLYGLERALFEGFCMGFLTLLSQTSENLVMPLILNHLLGDTTSRQRRQAILSQPPKTPSDGRHYVRFFNRDKDRQYWLMQGGEALREREDYIRTAYVERNLLNLVRATSTRRFPILIQGPTSAGKTSMIEYLAHFSGNKFVRINNHEHTDLQEYLGTYVSGADGKLRFQEGVLVQAMRQGHWIVLDELNLAPTDVLEALNRLLDDNRELLVPETQEVVRPHERFMLFATQNPAGLYAGRKVLSRAFRNRFLELHFDDIPEDELGYILQMRCRNTAPSDCERIVAVYKELSRLRQTSRVFEQKNSFATLRDLFRWALRDADNRDQIACHGFMLLSERVRDDEERTAVKGVIETIFKTRINVDAIYGPAANADLRQVEAAGPSSSSSSSSASPAVVWTKAMRRLFVLVTQALKNREPVLLVGETGCGKTTICQLVAEAAGRALHIVNAHQNTETGDLIGSQRPVRNRGAISELLRQDLVAALVLLTGGEAVKGTVDELLEKFKAHSPEERRRLNKELVARIARNEARSKALFEWSDGSLVQAMKTGSFFLLDEISLADDSVLERLNSVLEPQRTLLLAEKGVGTGAGAGAGGSDDDPSIQAQDSFQFLATMNPGGDFGKKELSPALRNRFTEIWVPPLTDHEDVRAIVVATLADRLRGLADAIVGFSYWFGRTFRASSATPFSIRDILVWAQFVNKCSETTTPEFALVHGAATVFIDTLGANPSAMVSADAAAAGEQRALCLGKLGELLQLDAAAVAAIYSAEPALRTTEDALWAGDFSVARTAAGALDEGFEFTAPTTRMNVMRVVRALQMNHKPVLLEGNPGVGKTTLISALARACGQPLTRINLSDQTDLMDLFGTDVPVEGAAAGHFAWRDAPFLQAMQRGEWVLLDEMNLASQTVLEGLNACLDHRGEVYIAELDQTFRRHRDFRLFAAQNPHNQGGGRKGLPSSFVNRFIVVYADVFSEADQLRIAHKRFPGIPADTVRRITAFVAALERDVLQARSFGLQGAPWEFNLRDTLRWLALAAAPHAAPVQDYLDVAVRQRFRTPRDRQAVAQLFAAAFGRPHAPHSLYHAVGAASAQTGHAVLRRSALRQPTPDVPGFAAARRLPELESLLVCVQHNLPCILVGASGTGKSALLRHAAALAGKPLVVFPLSADVDAMDLVGGFEQADPVREVLAAVSVLRESLQLFLLEQVGDASATSTTTAATDLLQAIYARPESSSHAAGAETAYFARIADALERLAPRIDAASPLAAALSTTHAFLQQPRTLADPRFEWLDSIIVQAAQAGHWLVLDNANLCSASVLDRLNSLLERPLGFLSINEHSGPDGAPPVVALHADFRIFLTVDPRYGELSRAMRNRSVEIFLDGDAGDASTVAVPDAYTHYITPVEARMCRFLAAVRHSASEQELLWLDNLSLGDSALLGRFLRAVEAGGLVCAPGMLQRLRALQSLVGEPEAQPVRDAILRQHSQLSRARFGDTDNNPASDRDRDHFGTLVVHEQPLHPLQNDPLVRAFHAASATTVAWWLAVCYERFADAHAAHEDLQAQAQHAALHLSRLSALTRLQRSSLAGQVPAVKRDSTAHAFAFLRTAAEAVLTLCQTLAGVDGTDSTTAAGGVLAERYMLNVVWHFWQRTRALTSQPAFDDATFQAHLGYGRRLLDEGRTLMASSTTNTIPLFVAAVARGLEDAFAAGFALTTGLSVDILWPVLRPLPIRDRPSHQHIAAMERLAARFDNLKWRVPAASAADLGAVVTSLTEAYRRLRADGAAAADVASLVDALAHEIGRLELQVGDDASVQPDARPLFATIFEGLRQLHVLYGGDRLSDGDRLRTLVLSDVSTLAQLRLCSAVGPISSQLQTVDHLLSQDASIHPWDGRLAKQLLRTCDIVSSASTLASLHALEAELPLVGRVVALSSAALIADPVNKLNGMLWSLLKAVIASHGEAMGTLLQKLLQKTLHSERHARVEITRSGLVIPTSPSSGPARKEPVQTLVWSELEQDLASWWPADVGHHVAAVLQEHLLPAFLALSECGQECRTSPRRQAFAAVAWVQAAVGCITLYTPDKVYDPYLKRQTEQEFDATLRASLVHKAASLRRFDHAFTGQDATAATSLRLALADDDIAALDANIAAAAKRNGPQQLDAGAFYRPPSTGASSELSRLQKDIFNPVLDVTVKDGLGAAHYRIVAAMLAGTDAPGEARQELQLIQGNVARLVERLLASFTAYQDLAMPLANLLRCLQLGLSLSEGVQPLRRPKAGTEASWRQRVAPFVGGRLTRVEDLPPALSQSRQLLQYAGVAASVDGPALTGFSDAGRRRICESFHRLFEDWKAKLVAEQRAEEEKSNLYRFRGSQEDEEAMDAAEFQELFPTYGGDGDGDKEDAGPAETASKPPTAISTWDLSADVARLHRDILQPSRPATDMISDFCKACARSLAKETDGDGGQDSVSGDAVCDPNETMLPAAMLVMDEQLRALQNTAPAATHYSFYTDAHLPEARKLVALVRDVQLRFRSLQRVDEIGHLQPLADVLAATDKVLELGFNEPLARVIPCVEKLHEALYEWQFRGYAPRQYGAPALYDRVTATLIAWRKLELSTWARLFDAEEDKCRQDSGAWWFIAYEAAVAGPMSILLAASPDASQASSDILAYHAEQLLTELAAYLAGSMAGQFAARLGLLRQIHAHLSLLVCDYPALAVICRAVKSLVAYYARYAPRAADAVRRGRDALQKKMNDVLLLASWRDTNIDALRESARRSHQKLFRLVRKFRAVLGQPMAPLIQQGLPEEAIQEGYQATDGTSLSPNADIDLPASFAAARVCAQLVPGWGDDAHTRRLEGVDRIVGIMAKAGAPPPAALDVVDIVDSFLADLVASAAALRKETPGLLTDDNKDAIKQLKTRKLRLFDDTVKAVRQMGFTNNLGTSRLAAQSSLAQVFAGYDAARLPSPLDLPGLELAFHKCLDLAPQFRAALHDHHSDLQHTAMRRCVGYLEGILFVALQQRTLLAKSARGLVALDAQIAYVSSLSTGVGAADKTVDSSGPVRLQVRAINTRDHTRALRWLVPVLRMAAHLVRIHARLGGADYRSVSAQLENWAVELDTTLGAIDAAPHLPSGFVSLKTVALRTETEKQLILLDDHLNEGIRAHPNIAYIFRQVKLWATDALLSEAQGTPPPVAGTADAFTQDALDLSKMVLDAVQKLSKAVADLPTNTEDAAWFVDGSTKLSLAVKSLHVETVSSSIAHCIALLRSVYEAQNSQNSPSRTAARALLRLLLPILQQYAATYRETMLRLAAVHRTTCQLGHRLSHAFVEIASQGFCTPPDKSSDASNDTSGKLEEGTGLGDGEGAEDISKDIQPDEDLSELAQTANQEKDKDDGDGIEDEKDAVDMGSDDMEGELGSAAGDDEDDDQDNKDDKDGDDEEDDMDEEAGDVDDLDPTAVDEKMWDGEDDAKDMDKEQQGNEAAGQKNEEDEQVAADENAAPSKPADETAAAGDEDKPEGDEDEGGDGEEDETKDEGADDDDIGSDDEEAGPQQELNRQDQNVDQNDVLDLPDDMQLDEGDEGRNDEDDDFDDLKDMESDSEEDGDEESDEKQKKDEDMKDDEDREAEIEEEDKAVDNPDEVTTEDKGDADEEHDEADEADEVDGEGAREEGQDDDEMDVDEDENEQGGEPTPEPLQPPNANDKDKPPAPSDVQSGVGQEQDNSAGDEEQPQDEAAAQNPDNRAKRDQGDKGTQDADDQNMAAGGDGVLSNRERDADQDNPAVQDDPSLENADQEARQPFKKLGDVLERWHKTRREIKQAEETTREQETNEQSDNQAAQQEFQHLHDEDAVPTAQAMGAADDDEARPFDDAMAIEEEEEKPRVGEAEDGKDASKHAGNDETNEDEDVAGDMADEEDDGAAKADADDETGAKKTEKDDGRAGASMVKGAFDREDDRDDREDEEMQDEGDDDDSEAGEDDDDAVASQLLSTHLDDDGFDDSDPALVSVDDALRQWATFQTATHPLSLALAAQLRLILTPSQATRLSGGFRTGKRLSIRKIIPYIASGYKRDKIWMRRAVPTKRAYQILLCVDDSRSMGEASTADAASSPGHLALSSLVMVGRALSMLEAGHVGVLGFGARVFTAHALEDDQSFGAASTAGTSAAQTLRRFTFQQDRTDVALLLRGVIDRFRHARELNAGSSSGSADLWQLALVLSDGLTPSAAHERIRQLLREAAEARIMVVFVVLDGAANNADKAGGAARSDSVLDLKEAKFIKDPATGTSRIVIERYLDTFPFPYYLIVHHLDDLPAALAGLLRTWFAEVNA